MRRRVFWFVTVACFVAALYEYVEYCREQAWLGDQARAIVGAAAATTNEAKVLALRDYIRRHVTYDGLPVEGRPFLRDTAKETLEAGRGYCGESTRVFINLAAKVGVKAKRVNLHGKMQHVVAETEIRPGEWILVDAQDNPAANKILDAKPWTVDQLITDTNSPFSDYSNLNLRRVPGVSSVVQRVKLLDGGLPWLLENPSLLKAVVLALAGAGLVGFWGFDRLLLRIYAWRLGIRIRRTPPKISREKESPRGVAERAA